MTNLLDAETPRGFSGKIPARGDFVHGGLPRDFLDPWNDWLERVIADSRDLMGDAWLAAFLEAPVWRFTLPPGSCGARAAVGLFLPSVDRVGRYFPLTFAALPAAAVGVNGAWSEWLEAAEAIGRGALEDDTPPDRLMPPPCPLSPYPVPGTAETAWWTDGGPRVAAATFSLPALPDAARFATMLGHPAPVESAS
jgi:type VI secretion system protein ImpM